jgi:hypothetical protein
MVRWGAIAVLCVLSIVGPTILRPHVHVAAPEGVIVRPGDTLWDHAVRIAPPGSDVRATVDELASANRLEAGQPLLAGTILEMPARTGATARLEGQEAPIR